MMMIQNILLVIWGGLIPTFCYLIWEIKSGDQYGNEKWLNGLYLGLLATVSVTAISIYHF